ncbi:MAG: hypothetical protein M3Q69_21665 [Acidobacteriota bacterium]|nr:hypothetical protein [Acidobacteriota bacterium]
MHRRLLILVALFLVSAVPMFASQFVELPFDQVAREAKLVVRASVVDTWSAWDDSHEIIYTYATLRVTRYFGETTGPDTLVVREVGGTIDGYTQQAVGFPEIRRGERVVLFLSDDENGTMRIHAYNQGKFLVRDRAGQEVLVSDPIHQGEERPQPARRFDFKTESIGADTPAMGIEEFASMVDDARAGGHAPRAEQRQ